MGYTRGMIYPGALGFSCNEGVGAPCLMGIYEEDNCFTRKSSREILKLITGEDSQLVLSDSCE